MLAPSLVRERACIARNTASISSSSSSLSSRLSSLPSPPPPSALFSLCALAATAAALLTAAAPERRTSIAPAPPARDRSRGSTAPTAVTVDPQPLLLLLPLLPAALAALASIACAHLRKSSLRVPSGAALQASAGGKGTFSLSFFSPSFSLLFFLAPVPPIPVPVPPDALTTASACASNVIAKLPSNAAGVKRCATIDLSTRLSPSLILPPYTLSDNKERSAAHGKRSGATCMGKSAPYPSPCSPVVPAAIAPMPQARAVHESTAASAASRSPDEKP